MCFMLCDHVAKTSLLGELVRQTRHIGQDKPYEGIGQGSRVKTSPLAELTRIRKLVPTFMCYVLETKYQALCVYMLCGHYFCHV